MKFEVKLALLSVWASAAAAASSFVRDERLSSVSVGHFTLFWDAENPYVMLTNRRDPGKVVFQTIPSQSFITVGFATDSRAPIVDGNYKVDEWTLFETPYQSIKKVEVRGHGDVVLSGEVWGMVTKATYEMRFFQPHDDDGHELTNQLSFEVHATPVHGTFNRLFLNYWCNATEDFYGFGTQFTHFNLKGRRVPILSSEQGIGRGAQPISFLLNFFGDRAGGDWSTTYAPKPLYLTNHHRSLLLENSEMMFFDLRDDDAVVIELWGHSMRGRLLYGTSMLDLVTEVTALTGRQQQLPEWTQAGAIVGLEGGTAEVSHLVDRLLEHGVPVSGVWLQDWVGLRKAFDGDRLRWNWQLDEGYYPGWGSMVRGWAEQHGIRTLSYINPFFSEYVDPNAPIPNVTAAAAAAASTSPTGRNLYREGIQHGYFVNKTGAGPKGAVGAYSMHSGSIEFCMLDTTNPAARRWMKDVMKYMIAETGVSGWMADFGEYVEWNSILHSGQHGGTYHNVYPDAWAELNMEAVAEARAEGLSRLRIKDGITNGLNVGTAPVQLCNASTSGHCEATTATGEVAEVADREVVYFMRSAWLQSPKHTPLFWLGDQLVTWDRHDGMKSAITGALSSGLGGHAIQSSDIGGYTMQQMKLFPYVRSRELLWRWTELAAFGHAMFRTHVGSNTSPDNAQIYDDALTLRHFGNFAKIFAALTPYRRALMAEAGEKGWPLMRPMAAHHADDTEVWAITDQFMFGKDFLVAPVLAPSSLTGPMSFQDLHSSLFADWGSYSGGRTTAQARNGGDLQGPVASVKVYVPRGTTWVHLWTGQAVSTGGDTGRYVSVDAPVGFPPVFYDPTSAHGAHLRAFVVERGWDAAHVAATEPPTLSAADATAAAAQAAMRCAEGAATYTCGAVIGDIVDYEERTWWEWLGVSEHVSAWEHDGASSPVDHSTTAPLATSVA